jgi:coproporphyrinogen III oxidase-like Fe-S oxidoreductase
MEIIHRNNNEENINQILSILNDRNIDYEISVIYGLPHQTLDTFKATVAKLRVMDCKRIKAYPLMLLKGTKLYKEKTQWGLKECSLHENHNIPTVISSNSFDEKEWNDMKTYAGGLNK